MNREDSKDNKIGHKVQILLKIKMALNNYKELWMKNNNPNQQINLRIKKNRNKENSNWTNHNN